MVTVPGWDGFMVVIAFLSFLVLVLLLVSLTGPPGVTTRNQ